MVAMTRVTSALQFFWAFAQKPPKPYKGFEQQTFKKKGVSSFFFFLFLNDLL